MLSEVGEDGRTGAGHRRAAVADVADGDQFAALTLRDREPDTNSGSAIVPGSEFVVETKNFRFALPAEPVTESMNEMVLDREVVGMSWTVDTDDHFVQVLAIDLGEPIDESMARAGFDSMNGGMARRADGDITSDEIFSDGDVWGRRTEITVDAGRLYATSFASGNWMVSVAARPRARDDRCTSTTSSRASSSNSPTRAS